MVNPDTLQGIVVDYETGQPLAGVHVTLGQNIDSTDSQGRFALEIPEPEPETTEEKILRSFTALVTLSPSELKRPSPGLTIEADNYLRLTTPLPKTRTVTVPLKRHHPRLADHSAAVGCGTGYLGITADGQPFGWSFATGRPTLDSAEADLFPSLTPEHLEELTALRGSSLYLTARGGLAAMPLESLGSFYTLLQHTGSEIAHDAIGYVDEAPEEGYTPSMRLPSSPKSGLVFVRTRDGRYAKTRFSEGSSSGLVYGSAGPYSDETLETAVGVQFRYVFAYDGTRLVPGSGSGGCPIMRPQLADAFLEYRAKGQPPERSFHVRFEMVDADGRLLDQVDARILAGEGEQLEGRALTDWPVYVYRDVAVTPNRLGFPVLTLTIDGHRASYRTLPPSSEAATSRYPESLVLYKDRWTTLAFEDYDTAYQPVDRTFRARLLD